MPPARLLGVIAWRALRFARKKSIELHLSHWYWCLFDAQGALSEQQMSNESLVQRLLRKCPQDMSHPLNLLDHTPNDNRSPGDLPCVQNSEGCSLRALQ